MKGRYEIYHKEDKKALAFGRDHAVGDFLQIWSTSESREPDSDNILVDEDTLSGLTRERMLELLAEHGFDESELAEAYESSL